jgi:hypothetical protein
MIASLASVDRRWSEAEPEDGTGQRTVSGAGGQLSARRTRKVDYQDATQSRSFSDEHFRAAVSNSLNIVPLNNHVITIQKMIIN